jgi:lysozyme
MTTDRITQPSPHCTGIIDTFHGDAAAIRKRGLTLEQALAQAKADGVVAVLAKATQGKDFVDQDFAAWARATHANGLLLGVYHFGSASEAGELQARWFMSNVARVLNAIDPSGALLASTLLCLDYERNPNPGGTITHEIAEAFVEEILATTGRAPLFYANSSTLHAVPSPTLARCPVWVAAYGNFVPDGPKIPAPYKPWLFWQYMGAESSGNEFPANEALYPRTAAGVGKVDRSVYRGTSEQLIEAWPWIGMSEANGTRAQ